VKKLRLTIDDHEIEMDKDSCPSTILEAAEQVGIHIPTLCHHPSIGSYGSCRLCTVQIERDKRKKFATACNYPVEDGLLVSTCSPEVTDIRKMILELLLARCPNERSIQELAREYGIVKPRYKLEDKSCILCGLCHRVCQELVGVSAINAQSRGIFREVDTPYGELSEDCIGCGACALICPTNSISQRKNIYPLTSDDIKELEGKFLTGIVDKDLGISSQMFAGKSCIEGQDGGMATSILCQGIKNGWLDAAVVAQKNEFNGANADLVDQIAEIMKARGTKYVRISVIRPLIDALHKGKKKVAVVGTPCQIRAVRKMQMQGYFDEKFPDAEIYIIGLFCFESFDYGSLKSHIETLLSVNIDNADKLQIAKGKFIVYLDGKEHSCRVRELSDDVRAGCGFCDDLTGRLADISIGSIGSPDKYSTVIVRSEKGMRLLSDVQFCRRELNKDEIIKLARLKKKNSDKNFSEILKWGIIVPGVHLPAPDLCRSMMVERII
jgi:coenzyme F420-reducing hydrogenase beta subunit